MLALIGSFLVKLLGSGIVEPVLSYLKQKDTTQRDIAVAQTGADRDRDIALVQASVEANRLRAAAQPDFRFLIYAIAAGPTLHFASVFLDSVPFWTPWGAHVVGSWGVPKLPEPYSTYQGQMLMSFFVVTPVAAAAKTIGAAIARR